MYKCELEIDISNRTDHYKLLYIHVIVFNISRASDGCVLCQTLSDLSLRSRRSSWLVEGGLHAVFLFYSV